MNTLLGDRRSAALLLAAVLLLLTSTHAVLLAQNLGAAPQTNVAVQGQTGAQPEGAFLNLVNWQWGMLRVTQQDLEIFHSVMKQVLLINRIYIS